MRAHRLTVDIADDHRLLVDLPDDFPSGPAEVIVLSDDPTTRRIVRLGGVLTQSEPSVDGDPVAEALDEIRQERTALLERRARRYSSTQADWVST